MKSTGTILVVDDTLSSLKMLVGILQAEGCDVRPANSGALALAAMATLRPDLVLLDIRMPEMDGFDVCRRLKADERTRDIPLIFLSAEADQKERIEGLSVGAVDFITKPFQREELVARIDAHLELRHLRRNLQEEIALRVQELSEKNMELERFLYTASHDLKSPVVTIRAFLGYLEADLAAGDAAKIEKDMHYMRVGSEKIARLLDDLLEFSRIGRVVRPAEAVTFQSLVDETRIAVGGRISEQEVAVTVDESDVTLHGDRLRFAEIFQNLVENACKFMGNQKEPHIEIGSEVQGAETVFFVRDNGIGIEPRYQDKVFSLFEKLDSSAEGTGLGLALVKRIVEIYLGRIWVESAGMGQGACFYFTLPAAVNSDFTKSS